MKIRKRLLSAALCLCMVVAMVPPKTVQAANPIVNPLGTAITYEPQDFLYVKTKYGNLEPVRLENKDMWYRFHVLYDLNKEEAARSMRRDNYNLNRFLTMNMEKTDRDYINAFPERWGRRPGLPVVFDGWIDLKSDQFSNYWCHYDSASGLSKPSGSNMDNMLLKGDVEYTLSYKAFTVKQNWVFSYSEDTCSVEIFNQKFSHSGDGTSENGYVSGKPYASGYPAASLNGLHFYAHSNKNDENDAHMHSGVLHGQDIKGPKIKSVKISADPAGKQVFTEPISLEQVSKLNNRTIYFQVEWDEPVRFLEKKENFEQESLFRRADGLTMSEIAKIPLMIQTIGKQGTAVPAEAYFHSYYPSKDDATPNMTFEYRIPDPYASDADTQTKKRGEYYVFDKVQLSKSENSILLSKIVDLAGNPVGVEKSRRTPQSFETKLENASVDLEPLRITEAKIGGRRDYWSDWMNSGVSRFMRQGDLLQIDLKLNKGIDTTKFEIRGGRIDAYQYPQAIPEVTLNLLDKDGKQIVLKANPGVTNRIMQMKDGVWEPVLDESGNPAYFWKKRPAEIESNSARRYSWLSYYLPLYPDQDHQYHLPEGEKSIKIVKITSTGEIKDISGQRLPDYKLVDNSLVPDASQMPAPTGKFADSQEYRISLNRQYNLDFDKPKINLDMNVVDRKNHILQVHAAIQDQNLVGTQANFHISFDGDYSDRLQYQSAVKPVWTDNWTEMYKYWTRDLGVNSPVGSGENGTGDSYCFIKLPEQVEFCNSNISVYIEDEGGNGEKSEIEVNGPILDTMAPRIYKLEDTTERTDVNTVAPKAQLFLRECSQLQEMSYAWARKGEPKPDAVAFKQATELSTRDAEGYFVIPVDGPANYKNAVETWTLWFRATDEHGNAADFQEDLTIDSRTLQLDVVFEGSKAHLSLQYTKNDAYYWWAVMEKPANYIFNGVDYGCAEEYLKAAGYDLNLAERAGISSDTRAGSLRDGMDTDTPLAPDNGVTKRDYTISKTFIVPSHLNNLAGDQKYSYGDTGPYKWDLHMGQKNLTDGHRPLLLVVGVNSNKIRAEQPENGMGFSFNPGINYELKAFEVPALENERSEIVARQIRFSTNNRDGVRQDYMRTDLVNNLGQGLLWADDPTAKDTEYPKVLNYPVVHDFAESQFYLCGDPITGLKNLDLQKSKLQLVKVYRDTGGLYPGFSTTPKWNRDGQGVRTVVQSWNLNTVGLSPVSQGTLQEYTQGATKIGSQQICTGCAPIYDFTVTMDPGMLDSFCQPSQDEYGIQDYNVAIYEFQLLPVYTNGQEGSKQTLTHFIFENDPASKLQLDGFTDQNDSFFQAMYRDHPVQAVLDENGRDITENVPIWDIGGETALVPLFQVPYDMGDRCFSILNSTVHSGNMGMDAQVHWGTAPDQMTHVSKVAQTEGTGFFRTVTDSHFNLAPGEKVRFYYQISDLIKGGKSAIYVIELYRDTTPPVVEVFVSETEKPVPEVQVKIESIYDGHWVGDGENRRLVTDTPTGLIYKPAKCEYYIRAMRDSLPEDPEFEYQAPIPVKPDKDGVYHFTSNGTIEFHSLEDQAGNRAQILVNGKPVTEDPELYYTVISINNVDAALPQILEQPQWKTDAATGSVTVDAKIDDPYAEAYIRFDEAYTNIITGTDPAKDASLVPVTHRLYSLNKGPGIMPRKPVVQKMPDGTTQSVIPGAVDEKGIVHGEFYVKPGETAVTATLVIVDTAGNTAESPVHTLNLTGVAPKITNGTGSASDSLPLYKYGGSLDTNVPVSLPDWESPMGTAHKNLPIYQDGQVSVLAKDLFDTEYELKFHAEIFSEAYRHRIVFRTADGKQITPDQKTNQDVTVMVSTADTQNLTVNGGKTYSQTFRENGVMTYTLNVPGVGQKKFELPIRCIDRTAPEPIISVLRTGPENDSTKAYTVTFRVEGFKGQDGVLFSRQPDGAAPSSVTFTKDSARMSHTFWFKDAVGNEGSYTVSAAAYTFVAAQDQTITDYRVTYSQSGGDKLRNLFTVSGQAGEAFPKLPAILTNSDISVTVEAYNKSGERVPFTMSKDAVSTGTLVFPEQNTILFTGEYSQERYAEITLNSGTQTGVKLRVPLPGNSIDTTAPTGSVTFVPEGETRKVYLTTKDTDLIENAVGFQGKQSDGKLLTLQKDQDGWFVKLDQNGGGQFLLCDKAGNRGSVSFVISDIDKEPPKLQQEGWSGAFEGTNAQLQELLKIPTNSSIFAFFRFDEQLSRVEAVPYDKENGNQLTPADMYVTAVVSGNTLTVEFKQNCQVRLVAYDLKGNAYTLWRPKDGPITVIDKDAPELIREPEPVYENNQAVFTYEFKNGDEVCLTGDNGAKPVYKNKHTITYSKNGKYILTFADRAGNILTVHPTVDRIDMLAPSMSVAMDVTDKTKSGGGLDAAGKPYYYTSDKVAIYLQIEDESGIQSVTAKRIARMDGEKGEDIPVKKGTFSLKSVQNSQGISAKTYNYQVLVEENGVYEIVAADRWGRTTTIRPSVSMIDRTGPSIGFANSRPVYVAVKSNAEEMRSAVMQGVTVSDEQSGKGTVGKEHRSAVTLSADLSQVDLNAAGTYQVEIKARDLLGNETSAYRTVVVSAKDFRSFEIDGAVYPMNEICVIPKGRTIQVGMDNKGNAPVTLYWSKGHMTAAQMKYAQLFDGSLVLSENGYYTIMAQSAEREMYLVYVFAS